MAFPFPEITLYNLTIQKKMKKNNINPQTHPLSLNLLGEKEHRDFLNFQSEYGIAIRGGSRSAHPELHTKRISSTINLLGSQEIRQLSFSGTLLNN